MSRIDHLAASDGFQPDLNHVPLGVLACIVAVSAALYAIGLPPAPGRDPFPGVVIAPAATQLALFVSIP
jgi:hypothetical protein